MRVEYKDYERMLNHMAWKAAKRTGSDFSEARSVANLAFMEAQRSWNPALSVFSTHLTHVFSREFYRANRGPKRWEEVPDDMVDQSDLDKEVDFRVRLDRLSTEAKEVVGLIFDSPVELFDWTVRTVKTTKTNLIKYLSLVAGWDRRKINCVFEEIQNALKS